MRSRLRRHEMAATALAVAVLAVAFPGGLRAERARDPADHARRELNAWACAMEAARADNRQYPQGQEISTLATLLHQQGYWTGPVVTDPWGRPYRCESSAADYRIWSLGPDGLDGTGDDVAVAREGEQASAAAPQPQPEPRAVTPPHPRGRVGNTLTVTRSGNDLVLSWAPTGSTYTVVGSATPGFFNPYLLSQQAATTFTYTAALSGSASVEFFDVADESETSRGEDGAGNLPPSPPVLDPPSAGTAFAIGSTATLTGTFAQMPEDNTLCLAGGICFWPDATSGRSSQLDLTVPVGAVSSSLSVSNGILQSDPVAVEIHLEDPPVDMVRAVGFARRAGTGAGGEYWTSSKLGGVDHVYRHSYSAATGKWVREAREGLFTDEYHLVSTKTDYYGNLYAGVATSADAAGTRIIATDPPADMLDCRELGTSPVGAYLKVLGAAPDPNPNRVSGRDVVYFAWKDTFNDVKYVKKVEILPGGTCGAVVDQQYGGSAT